MKYTIKVIEQNNIKGDYYISCFVNKKSPIAYKIITDGNTCTARIIDDYNLQGFRCNGSEFPKYILNNLKINKIQGS